MKRATNVIAAVLGCTAFAIACVGGLAAHNPSNVVLTRALWALVVCYIAGLVLGTIGELIIAQHIALYAKQNPIPEIKPLQKEPVLVAELAEDQIGAGVQLGGMKPGQVAQVAQSAQSAQGERKAA